MNALKTDTLEQCRTAGYTHLNCACHNCGRMVSLRISAMPMTARPLTLAALAMRLKCKKCGAATDDISPWRERESPKMW